MRPSQARIDRGVRYMKRFLASDDALGFMDLDDDAKLMYIIGILICNDVGLISKDKLDAAVTDDSVRYAAVLVASRSGAMPGVPAPDRYA
jgi:hypothetical protein